MFSTNPITNFTFCVAFILSSTNAFNLDKGNILSCNKDLKKDPLKGRVLDTMSNFS